jgi:myo-inositol-1(or 4)-monophosphatase
MDDFLSVACEAARSAGGILKKGFGSKFDVRAKSPNELVSEYDLKSEKEIISRIRKNFPDHGIYSEESGDLKHDSSYLWVLDPLDGTHNFIYGLPHYGVSIGLLKDGKPLLGVIYLPESDELLQAVKGGGAFLNGRRLRVSKRPIERAFVFYQCPYPRSGHTPYAILEKVTHHVQALRILGVAVTSFEYLASGCADAYLMHSLRPYDVAAGALIVEEAGGRTTDFDGKPWRMESKTFLASNGLIHEKLLEIVK